MRLQHERQIDYLYLQVYENWKFDENRSNTFWYNGLHSSGPGS